MEEIEARIRARNREKEMMVGMLRVGVPDYPERALREAVANALIHRDYLPLGLCIFSGIRTKSRSAILYVSDNVALSRCNRSKWCCNTLKSMGVSPVERRLIYVELGLIRPIGCSLVW